jgi:hypothetical protein
MTGSAASGDWENNCMVGEHVHMATSFLKYFYRNGEFSLKFITVT